MVERGDERIMMERLRGAAAEIAAEMTAWRREFHAHPELSFEEVGTTRRVAELLRSFGYDNLKVGLGGEIGRAHV